MKRNLIAAVGIPGARILRCGRGGIATALLLLSLLTLGSCRFLADEFTWLDRAGPVADGQPDAPTIGTVDRP